MKRFTTLVTIKFFLLGLAFLSLVLLGGEEVRSRFVLISQGETDETDGVLGVEIQRPHITPAKVGNEVFESEAISSIALDFNTLEVLYEHNPNIQVPMASTTKIMAAYVALEEFDAEHIITVQKEDIDVIGSILGLEEGEKIYMSELVKGMLVRSGNDAAHTLENEFERNGKSLTSLMNMYVDILGLENTNFVNASGLDEDNHFSSAKDLAIIAKFAMSHDSIREAVNKPSVTISSVDGKVVHTLYSTNQLFGVLPGLVGIKTGYTAKAGQCLVGSTIREGNQIITVVLNSPDRFEETVNLTEWVYRNYSWN